MASGVRVRYAPSPTGGPHVGNIRTALFDWLFARGSGGSFIIRVEDTDQQRKVAGATEELLDALGWLGIDWDEGPDIGGDYGPYHQSERLDSYRQASNRLIAAGMAYRCYCSPERLASLRAEQARLKQPIGYDRRCRELGDGNQNGDLHVVRFAMPLDGETNVSDLIRGDVSFDNALIDDFVLVKSDGFPTYHLASVVDDHAMEISHVLRAEEWLPSLPRHTRIYEALGLEPPLFAHLPNILAPDRSKLSKRHGATSVLEYRDQGYLPRAMVNFLVLLGWSLDGKTELFSAQELFDSFSLDRVSKSAAIFDTEKLGWMNGHYIRESGPGDLADALLDYWQANPPMDRWEQPDRNYVLRIIPLVRERLKTMQDAFPLVAFLFRPAIEYDPADLVQKGMDAESTKLAMERATSVLESLPGFDTDAIEGALRPLAVDLGIKVGQLLGSIRVATTGQRVAPPLFEALEVLGRERSLAAMKEATRQL